MSEHTQPSTRIGKAKPHLQLIALLLYIMDQEEPKDYLILSAVKYFKNITGYAKAETIRHLFSIPEKEFYERVDRMRKKGWVAMEGEYINTSRSGDGKIDEIIGWMSLAMYNIQERNPLEEWSRLMKD